MHNGISNVTIEAVEKAIALSNVYSYSEIVRELTHSNYDVMKTAYKLKQKYEWKKNNNLINITIDKVYYELKKKYIEYYEDACDLMNCPVIYIIPKNFKPSNNGNLQTISRDKGTIDGSTSYEELLKLFVYILEFAIKRMENSKSPGIVYVIDLHGYSKNNFDLGIITRFFNDLRCWYPNTVQFIHLCNKDDNLFIKSISNMCIHLIPEKTKPKINYVCSDNGNGSNKQYLESYIGSKYIPSYLNGLLCSDGNLINDWALKQAKIENVDLTGKRLSIIETKYMQAVELNGMQYASCSAKTILEMKCTSIRGMLWQKTGDSSSGISSSINFFGVGWSKRYGVLRPDALLLYENLQGNRPEVIIPIKGCSVTLAQFPNGPRGTFGFKINVPMTCHLFASNTEEERGQWIREIELSINILKDKVKQLEMDLDKELETQKSTSLISFDEPLIPHIQNKESVLPSSHESLFSQPSIFQANTWSMNQNATTINHPPENFNINRTPLTLQQQSSQNISQPQIFFPYGNIQSQSFSAFVQQPYISNVHLGAQQSYSQIQPLYPVMQQSYTGQKSQPNISINTLGCLDSQNNTKQKPTEIFVQRPTYS